MATVKVFATAVPTNIIEQAVALSWATPSTSTNSTGTGNATSLTPDRKVMVSRAPSKPPIVGKLAVPVMSVVALAITVGTPLIILTTETTTPGIGTASQTEDGDRRRTLAALGWEERRRRAGEPGLRQEGAGRDLAEAVGRHQQLHGGCYLEFLADLAGAGEYYWEACRAGEQGAGAVAEAQDITRDVGSGRHPQVCPRRPRQRERGRADCYAGYEEWGR